MFNEKISILVPYKPDGGHRDKNWSWIRRRYELLMPEAEICMAYDESEHFCKSNAINKAAKMATTDLFLIADADIIFDIEQMKSAIDMLSQYTWVIPFWERKELSEEGTHELLQKDPTIPLTQIDFKNCGGHLYNPGTLNIVPRKYFERVGGFDERFKGWGGEDDAFLISMDTLCGPHGRPKDTTALHLYHPQPSSKTNYNDSPTYQANYALYSRYHNSFGNKEAIQALLDERTSENIK